MHRVQLILCLNCYRFIFMNSNSAYYMHFACICICLWGCMLSYECRTSLILRTTEFPRLRIQILFELFMGGPLKSFDVGWHNVCNRHCGNRRWGCGQTVKNATLLKVYAQGKTIKLPIFRGWRVPRNIQKFDLRECGSLLDDRYWSVYRKGLQLGREENVLTGWDVWLRSWYTSCW